MLVFDRQPAPTAGSHARLRWSLRNISLLAGLSLAACGGNAIHEVASDAGGSGGVAANGASDAGGSGRAAAGGGGPNAGGTGGNGGASNAGGFGGTPNSGASGGGPLTVVCPSGFFATDGACELWSDCGAGQYVKTAGSATTNRYCASCELGSFSSSTNASECTAWTLCKPEQYATTGDATKDQTCAEREWTRQFGTEEDDEAYSLSVGGGGTVYVVGTTRGSLAGSNAGGVDAFVHKYTSAGVQMWAHQFGTPAQDVAESVSVDASGSMYVAGWTDGTLSGANAGAADAFVRKYDSAGAEQWTRQFGSSENDTAHSVSVDASGNVYVAGGTHQGLSEATAGSFDAYVRKYSSEGTIQWTRQWGSASLDEAYAVSVDASGNLYVAGITQGDLAGKNAGDTDAFVCKFNSAGAEQWRRQFGMSGYDFARSVSTDASGNVYVVGSTEGVLHEMNSGLQDAFVRKYSSAGTEQWTRQFGTTSTDYAQAVRVDASGNAYVAGGTYGSPAGAGEYDAFVRKYDSVGTMQWARQLGTVSSDAAAAVGLDASGNVYLGGYTMGALSGMNAGLADGFVTKLAP